jgi:putative flippase GtrA
LLYTAFAVLATLANLGTQRAVLGGVGAALPPAQALILAMIFGTAAGLVLKYILDKRWIFDDRSRGLAAHSRRFGLYTVMGLVTTLIFWATEFAFWHVGQTDAAREAGAILGLAIGYAVKYILDRRYVFTTTGQTA